MRTISSDQTRALRRNREKNSNYKLHSGSDYGDKLKNSTVAVMSFGVVSEANIENDHRRNN